jgi:non-specific serine/threonine protein kinase
MNGQDATSFGVVLRSQRVAAGLTQEALAKLSGLGVRSIQGLERGETHPRRETLQRMAGALGLTGEQLAAFEVAAQAPARPPMATTRVRADIATRSGIASGPRHHLPGQLTTFIGRERERLALNERLATTRLLTLTGTGGCGKTRLALEVAADGVAGFPDGVWLVELAAFSDPALIAKAVATAIGVREAADRPVRGTLLVALQSRRLLLVVDNCEHLREGCAALVEALLRTCPGVSVLATSREPLGLDGEVAWRVPSLSVAPDERSVDPARLRAYEAVRLFVDWAMAAEPAFVLTEHNAAAISQICRRLDGIPLAIELAARRVSAMSPDQIAERLDRRFHLLTRGSPAALPRQQTLAATVDWSYNLLSARERVLFDRLAAFPGGFTLDAAEAVAGDADEGTETSGHSTQSPARLDALDLLTRLVNAAGAAG